MKGCPEAPQSENVAPWQCRRTSITQSQTQSEAAAAGRILQGSAEVSEDLTRDGREAVSSASQLEKRGAPGGGASRPTLVRKLWVLECHISD